MLGQIHPPDVGAETNSRHDADAIRCYTTDIASCFILNAGGGGHPSRLGIMTIRSQDGHT